jgi:hypothetical protein
MLRLTSRLAVLVVSIAASAQSANALVILNFDQQALFPFTQPLPAGFNGVPGQTMGVVTPYGAPNIVDCALIVGACSQSTGGIASTSSALIPGTGVSVAMEATTGGDTVRADVRETCTSSCVTSVSTQTSVADYQHVMAALAGPIIPEFVDIDVTFTLASSFVDNSTVAATSPYAASAISSLFVGEASTYTVSPTNGTASIFAALDAQVIAARDISGNVTANESLVGVTQTIHLRPNADYWVGMMAKSVTFFFQFGMPGPAQDYTGLDLSFSMFADPTFALNAAWAAANPELAANVTIGRQFNGMPVSVPEPATTLLLLTSLAFLLFFRVRSRATRQLIRAFPVSPWAAR